MDDSIIVNESHVLYEAKNQVLEIGDGYIAPGKKHLNCLVLQEACYRNGCQGYG